MKNQIKHSHFQTSVLWVSGQPCVLVAQRASIAQLLENRKIGDHGCSERSVLYITRCIQHIHQVMV